MLETREVPVTWTSTGLSLFGSTLGAAVTPNGTLFAADGSGLKSSTNQGSTWQQLTASGVSAGGAIAYPASNPSVMLAGRSGGLLKSVDGGATWFALSGTGDAPAAIAFEPGSDQVAYAGSGAGSGVYKTTNGGATWTRVLSSRNVTSLVIDPEHPQTVYAGALSYAGYVGGLLKSTDGGATWTASHAEKKIDSLLIDPSSPQALFAGTDDGGLYISGDGGANWSKLPGPSIKSTTPVKALVVDPRDHTHLLAATKGEGVFSSTDGGATWGADNQGLPDLNTVTLAVQSFAPFALFTVTSTGKGFQATLPPLPAAPALALVTVNDKLLTDADVGAAKFTVTIDFSKAMDPTVAPTLTFAPSVAATLTRNAAQSGWLDADTYVARYDVADANIRAPGVTIGVTDARDSAGNAQQAYPPTTQFAIDTVNPAPVSWSATALSLSTSRVYDISVAVTPDSTLFAADGTNLKRSSNQGATWQTVTLDPGTQAGGAITYAPSNPSVLMASADSTGGWSGVLKSVDGGEHWFKLPDFQNTNKPSAIAFRPDTDRIAYAGFGFGWGVYLTFDGGTTWYPTLDSVNITCLAVDPQNPLNVYAGAAPIADYFGGLFKSTDGGVTWAAILPAKPVRSLLLDPASPQRVYAGTDDGGIWRSPDGGATWAELTGSTIAAPVRALAFDPQNSAHLYAGTAGEGLFSSIDGGATWGTDNQGLTDLNIYALAAQANFPYRLFAATYSGKGFRTAIPAQAGPPTVALVTVNDKLLTDADVGAAKFTVTIDFSKAMDQSAVPTLTFTPSVATTLTRNAAQSGWLDADTYVARYDVADAGIRAPSVTIGVTGARDSAGNAQQAYAPTTQLAIDTVNPAPVTWAATTLTLSDTTIGGTITPPGTLLAADGSGIKRSADSGVSWQSVTAFGVSAGGAIAYAPSNPPVLLAGQSGGTLKSVDDGRTWTPAGTLPTTPSALLFDPASDQVAYAGCGYDWGVYKSTNGGAKWSQVLPSRSVTSLALDPLNPQTLYAGTVTYSSNRGAVLKSTNGGATWTTVLPNQEIDSLLVDPASPERVYAGSEDGRIFRSTDGGATWTDLTGWTITAPIRALALDPRNSAHLYAATPGEGVFSSTDGGTTWGADNLGLTDLNVIVLATRATSPYTPFLVTYGGNGFLPSAAPAAPAVTGITTDTGASPIDGITSDPTLLIAGTAAANATITLLRDGVSLGTTTVNAAGAWNFDYTSTTLAQGTYVFKARATSAGATSPDSAPFTVMVDTTAPAAPVVTGISTDTGASAADGITNDTTLVISGTAEPGSTVTVLRDGTNIGTTTANAAGAWSFDYTSTTLAQGTYVFKARATDLAGNTSADSAGFTAVVDTTGPMVTDVLDVTPDPRTTPVASLDVVFSEPINLATFTFADVTLTRDGQGIALDSSVVVGWVSGSTYRISGLEGFTTLGGSYVLTVTASGVQDLAGNAGRGSASDSWARAMQIVDDGDAGFAASGPWTRYTGQGLNNSLLYAGAGDGAAVATWTLAVTPGQYRASVTWPAHSNRASNAPYTVLDGVTPLPTIPVNQQQPPADRTDTGVGWKDLGVFNIHATSLTVRLTNAANGYVVADGLRLDRLGDLPVTSVAVLDGTIVVSTGDTVSYGATQAGLPVTRTFTVKNNGTATLTLGTIIVPPGFTLTAGFGSTSLAAGASTTFQVSLTAATVGTFSGPVSFATSDPAFNPFTFTVTGTVVSVTITDNTDAGFAASGPWTLYPGLGLNNSLVYAAAGDGAATAAWTTTVTAGVYRVSVTWPAHSNRVSNAPYTVLDGDTLLTIAPINQQQAAADFTDKGVGWKDLGVFDLNSNSLVVKLTNAANGYVVADAVRVERVADLPAESVLVRDGLTFIPADGAVNYGDTEAGRPLTRTFTVRNNGAGMLTLGAITVPTGFTLTAGFGSTSLAVGATTTFQVSLAAAAGGTFSGSVSFATSDPAFNPFTFTVAGTVAATKILDNGQPGFAISGPWTPYTGQGLDSSLLYAPAGDGAATAAWTATVTPGQYRVSVTWSPHSNRASNAPYTVLDGATPLATVPVNQRQSPADRTDAGVGWMDLGVFAVSGHSLTVNLTNAANGYVIADAVRIELLVGLPTVEVQDGAVPVPAGGTADYGVTMTGRSATKTFTVKNNGLAMLTLGAITVPAGFSLAAGFGSTSLAFGASTTFQVSLAATAAGTSAGLVSFGTSDPGFNPCTFTVTGTVASVAILDNTDAGFAVSGPWTPYAGQGLNSSLVYVAAGDGSATAAWTLAVAPGQYRVSVTWPAHSNRASNVPYTVLDGATTLATVLVNQRQAPADRTDAGVGWKDLGVFDVTGPMLVVRLTNLADGFVVADALRIERVA